MKDQPTNGSRPSSGARDGIAALQQLEQFILVTPVDEAIWALSGVRISPIAAPDDVEHGMLYLTFPGMPPVEANGDLYLQLKVVESARLELDGPEGSGRVATRVQALLEHLRRKHAL